MTAKKTELAHTDETVIENIPIPEGNVMPIKDGYDFTTLAGSLLDATQSRELLKVKEDLVGVAMISTSYSFRPVLRADGIPVSPHRDYVSVEATTYDNRRVVFNDGSTGIHDQILELLVKWGVLPEEYVKVPCVDWDEEVIGMKASANGTFKFEADRQGNPLAYLLRNGLRASEYDTVTPAGEDVHAITYYIA